MKNMLRLTLPFFLLAFCTTAQAQRTVFESEQMRFQAQVARDTAALERLLADDLVYVHSNALVEDKAAFIHSVGGGGIRYLAMEKTESLPLQTWGKVALCRGIVKVKGALQGNAFDMTLRFTSVYRKEKGIWKLISWQSTRVP